MLKEFTLNVTLLEPRLKHSTIFAMFDQLEEGENLTLLNDHDPKPLYYQLLGERGEVFDWEYLEEGPVWWRVRIGKRKTGESGDTLGEIVAKDYRKAQVFKKYGLDFCCGGQKTVKQACAEKGLDAARIEHELQQTVRTENGAVLPYNEWQPGFLADFIVNTHHLYIKKNLPDIKNYALKVAKVHGARHSELLPVCELVDRIAAQLEEHLEQEEKLVFPYIKSLEVSGGDSCSVGGPGVVHPSHAAWAGGSLASPIRQMREEHETVGNELASLRRLTGDYGLPEDACASYSLLYRMLDDFEQDFLLHAHLENNVLFPKALILEQS